MQDLRLSPLSAIKLHSFSNYFVSLLSPLKFLGLASFFTRRLPVAAYLQRLQPRGPFLPPPRLTLALDMELGQKCFLNTRLSGWRACICAWQRSVMFPVSGGTSGEGAELMDRIGFSLLTKITGGSCVCVREELEGQSEGGERRGSLLGKGKKAQRSPCFPGLEG